MVCFLDESAATQTLVLNGDTEERDSIEDDPFTASNMEVCMYIHHNQECITYPTFMYSMFITDYIYELLIVRISLDYSLIALMIL